jgi:MFS family permease
VVAHFIQALAWSSMIMMPVYLEHLGASRAGIGTVMAAAAIGGLALRPAVGWSLDVLGRRPTLVAGTLTVAVALGMVGWVQTIGPLLYLHRILFGMGIGALFTGYFTFASDVIPESRRTEGIALFGISGLIPLGFNAFVGEVGIQAPELRLLYPVVGALLMTSLIPLLAVPEPERKVPRKPLRVRAALAAIGAPALWPAWTASVVFAALVAGFFSFATVTAAGRGVDRPALLWLTYAGGATLVRLVGGRLPDRVGTRNLVAPALGTYILACLLIGSVASSGGFLLIGMLAGIGHGYCFPVLASQIVTRAPDHLRGTALATYTALWEAARLAATPALGAIADHWDDATMFALAGLGAVGGLAAWAALEHRHGEDAPDGA